MPRISKKLLKLKTFMHKQHQHCQLDLSTPIIRADSAKAASVVAKLREQLLNLKMQVTNHNNITENHLRVKGLHLK